MIEHNRQKFMFRSMFKSIEARNAVANEVRAVVTSFHPMTANDKQLAKPYQIRTLALPAGRKNVSALARGAPLGRYAEQELRLINGVYPQGERSPGQLVKTVVQ